MRKAGTKHVAGCSKYSYDESNGLFTTASFMDLGLDKDILKGMVKCLHDKGDLELIRWQCTEDA